MLRKQILMMVIALTVILQLCAQDYKGFKYEITGKGKPVILIPGFSCSGEVWKETVAHLKDRYECHVLTLAGYAGVPAQASPDLGAVKNDIIKYVRDKKLYQPVIIGHSLGAFMGLWVNSEKPDIFGKLICVDGMPFLSALSNPDANADSLKKNPMFDPEIVARHFINLSEDGFIDNTAKAMLWQVNDTARAREIATWQYLSDRRTLGLTLVEISTTDLRKKIASITSPVLVLGSIYLTKENSMKVITRQFEHLPGTIIKVADSKHFIMYDQPEWMYNEIDTFLRN